MLATLYDLEIVEDPAVRDWLDPPSENRHQFLKQAKAVFAVKDNVEAKKQVLCVLVYVHISCLMSLSVVCGHVCISMIHNSPTARHQIVLKLETHAVGLLPGKVNKDVVKRSPKLVHEVDQMF